ncbi:MAG: hypothetical protein AAF604_19395 [Acidobacteriota bacterium]
MRRCLVVLLLLAVGVALVAPALAADDCGCCGGSCDTACCLLRAKAGFSIGHPTSERPHWKAPREVRSDSPCGATCGAASSLPLPDRATGEAALASVEGTHGGSTVDAALTLLDPQSRPAAPRGPPLLP